ncbi:hypothetical protein ABW21_db0200760 [Orbilia brochopaga]|nr:hypothetical protein ABW21_db0200760 [Drechslerella brochopaga]
MLLTEYTDQLESFDTPRRQLDPNDMCLCSSLTIQKLRQFRDECFPKLRSFDGDIENCISRYPGRRLVSANASLSPRQRSELVSWMEPRKSRILWVDGCSARAASDWTTDLALEVIGAAATANASAGITVMTPTYQFCSENDGDKRRTPENVIQGLLFQLIRAHIEKFDRRKCQGKHLTRSRLRDGAKDSTKLWDLFRECVISSEIKLLLVVLDNVDSLFSASKGNEKTRKGYYQLIDNLLKLVADEAKVIVKILVTSRIHEATEYFCEKAANSHGYTLLKVPRPPERLFAQRRNRNRLIYPSVEDTQKPTKTIVSAKEDSSSGTAEEFSDEDDDLSELESPQGHEIGRKFDDGLEESRLDRSQDRRHNVNSYSVDDSDTLSDDSLSDEFLDSAGEEEGSSKRETSPWRETARDRVLRELKGVNRQDSGLSAVKSTGSRRESPTSESGFEFSDSELSDTSEY